jgi:uncharacterized protein (DUF1684 family)
MRYLILLLLLIINHSLGFSQTFSEKHEDWKNDRTAKLLDSDAILNGLEQEGIASLSFFDYDTTWIQNVEFIKNRGSKESVATSSGQTKYLRRIGYLCLEWEGNYYRLTLYEFPSLPRRERRKNLFLPFIDENAPDLTYAGGRYLDLKYQNGKNWIVDFNFSYNPYCVYSHRFSCPIPPAENNLSIAINAGEQMPIWKKQ